VRWWHLNLVLQVAVAAAFWLSWHQQTRGSALFGGVISGLLLGELLWRGAYEHQRTVVRRFVEAADDCRRRNG
jgi:hypothetical protein